MIAPFHVFIPEEGKAQENGGRLEEEGAVYGAPLDRRDGKDHGETAGKENEGIYGPQGYAHFSACCVKISRVLVAVNRIQQEHAAEEKDLREQEEPHPEFGAQIVAVFDVSEFSHNRIILLPRRHGEKKVCFIA